MLANFCGPRLAGTQSNSSRYYQAALLQDVQTYLLNGTRRLHILDSEIDVWMLYGLSRSEGRLLRRFKIHWRRHPSSKDTLDVSKYFKLDNSETPPRCPKTSSKRPKTTPYPRFWNLCLDAFGSARSEGGGGAPRWFKIHWRRHSSSKDIFDVSKQLKLDRI